MLALEIYYEFVISRKQAKKKKNLQLVLLISCAFIVVFLKDP